YARAVAGRLPGWRLVFDKPPLFPIGESYANLVEDAAARTYGVLYEARDSDLEQIDLTEGVPLGNYHRIEVSVAALSNDVDTAVVAHTLVSDRRDESLCPSHRYMELVIAGAELHRLPAEHIAALRKIPSRPSTPEALQLQERLHELMRQRR